MKLIGRRTTLATLLMVQTVLATAATGAEPRGWFGLGFSVQVSPVGDRFLVVRGVAPDSPASRAGIAAQNLITAIDGKPIAFRDDLEAIDYLAAITPERIVTFTVIDASRHARQLRLSPERISAEAALVWKNSRKQAERARATARAKGKKP